MHHYCFNKQRAKTIPVCQWISLSLIVLLLAFTAASQPVITSFSPQSGQVGAPVTITGNNFSTTPSANIVYFGIVRATVTASTSTSLTLSVPAGASSGPISVTVNGLTSTASQTFTITFPAGEKSFYFTSFGWRLDYESPGSPVFFGLADLDNDLKPDGASVNKTLNRMSLFRNRQIQGIFDFQPKIDYPVGINPTHIKFTDLDGDGKLDIIVTNSGSNSLSLFRNITTNEGNIILANREDITTISTPDQVTTADLNGDGKPEIIVNSEVSGLIRIHLNTSTPGAITFGSATDLSPGNQPTGIAAWDMDGDTKADLAVSRASNSIALYRNTGGSGTISFATKVDLSVSGGSPKGITINDLNLDNKPELIFVSSNTNEVSVMKNNSISGNLSFDANQSFATGPGPVHVAVNDLNGDGKPDLATANFTGNNFSVLKNTTSGASISFAGKVDYITGNGPGALVINDVDSDGEADIFTTNTTANTITFYKNKVNDPGIFSFTPTSGPTGTVVTITGINFTGLFSNIWFGGTAASSYTVVSDELVTATVGSGATGIIQLSSLRGGSSSNDIFTYLGVPQITQVNPNAGTTGSIITITGNNLVGTTAVSFGGTPAASFTVNSHTSITATVAAGASGNVSVTNPYGTATFPGFNYTIPTAIFDPSNNNSNELVVSPNPGKDGIVIIHPSVMRTATIRFFDVLGKEVRRLIPERNSKETYTNVKQMTGGVYYVMWTDGKRVLTRTILVE